MIDNLTFYHEQAAVRESAAACIIRVSFTGEPPTLPPAGEVLAQPDVREADEVRDAGADDDGFYPDPIYDD